VATLLLAGWWYFRNLRLYGSLTGLNYMLPEGVGRELNLTRWLRGLPAELLGLWRSSWGLFGWFTLPLPAWTYALIDGATALAALGLARAGWAARGEGRSSGGSGSEDAEPGSGLGGGVFALPPHVRPPWQRMAWLALWWLLLFAALLRWLLLVKGAHGRLLFPAWVFVAIALVAGWRSLLPRAIGDRALALAVGAAMLGLSLGALLGVIRPAFAGPSTIAEEAIPASATRVDALFGDGLRLLAVEHPARVVEGELLPVTLYWWVEGETSAEGAVAPAGGAPTETEGAAGGSDRAPAEGLARPGLVALRLDQIAAIAGEDPDAGGRGALNHRPKLHRFAAQAYLAHPGAGTAPIVSLPPGRVIVDRHRIPVPMLVTALPAPAAPFVVWDELDDGTTGIAAARELAGNAGSAPAAPASLLRLLGPGANGPDDPARRFAMPVEARLSIHIYDREAGEAWPVAGADAAVGGAGEGVPPTDVERRVVLESRGARAGGQRIVDRATPVAAFGEARALRLGLVTSVTEGSAEGRDVIYVAGPGSELGSGSGSGAAQGGAARTDGGSRTGQDAAGAALPWLQHVVPDPRDLSITWNATRVVWSVERAIERDLALFVHLVDEAGLVVRTFDGDPVTHGIYPSSLWRAGDVLVADLGWSVPDDARTGDRFTLLVGLYERVEGGPAPRLPAFDPDGERYLNDAVPLVAIEVGRGEAGGMRRPDVGP
jgi:hypothetical protein